MNDFSMNNDYETVLQRAMAFLPNNIDKRVGSVAYNFLAPYAFLIAEMYVNMDRFQDECFADTASLDGLLLRCQERGIDIQQASSAILRVEYSPQDADIINKSFSLNGITYTITDLIVDGSAEATCDTTGTAGNQTGYLLPLTDIEGLETIEATSILIYGEEQESQESLLERYLASFQAYQFGGNISDYRYNVDAVDGVGGCRVFPIWNGGGTVKVVVIASDYSVPTAELIAHVQNAIDPTPQGTGLGIAPIGHTVTVAGVSGYSIDVSAELEFEQGYTLQDVIAKIDETMESYLLSLRESWERTPCKVRIGQVESEILAIDGIVDVNNIEINGYTQSFTLGETSVPIWGHFNELQ